MIFLVYRCSPASTVICINEEFSEYAWTTRAQLELLDLNELTRTTLKSAGFLGPPTDSTQIHSAIDAFIHAYNTGDLESLLSLYAQDLVKLRQGSAPESKADTAARLLAFFAANTGALVVHNDEVMISGDFAF